MTPYIHRNMHNHQQNLHKMTQTSVLFELLKKLTQVALSFSLFSFFLLHPSSLPFFRSFISNFFTNPSHLLSLATDKNYIFLLCNGILVFIAKYSSRTVNTNQPSLETNPDTDIIYRHYSQSLQPPMDKSFLVKDVVTEDSKEEERLEVRKTMPEEEPEEERDNFLFTDGPQNEEDVDGTFIDYDYDDNKELMKRVSESGPFIEEEEEEEQKEENDEEATVALAEEEEEKEEEEEEVEEEDFDDEEEEIAKMSTEELNRKFDDFIRKMKEELRFEAQQQLIMV